MWIRSTLMFIFGVAAVKVQSARFEDELCPRQDPPRGVMVLKLESNVVFGCRGDVTVDNVLLASASVLNKQHRNKQREDITVSWTSRRHDANSTQLTSMKGDAPNGTYQKIDSGLYSNYKVDTTVTNKPYITTRKGHSTSQRVLRAVSQTPGEEEEALGITMWSNFDEDDYEDYDYKEEGSRVTRGIKKRTRWTFNGRETHVGVERGGILRRPRLSWADAGNYSCYRGERLVSTFRISVGAPPESPVVFCYRKSHTSKVRCDWTSKHPVIPRPLCYLLCNKNYFGNTTRVPCSFSRSRCWCAFPVDEDDKALHRAQLCVSNIAGSVTSPILSFKPHNIIKPDPPSRVSVRAVEGQNQMLKVFWSYPSSWKSGYYVLQFHLRYRPQNAEQYQPVMIYDKMERHLSLTIYDALPHTIYEVQIQAKDEFDGIWSDWTKPVYAVTWPGKTDLTHSSRNASVERGPGSDRQSDLSDTRDGRYDPNRFRLDFERENKKIAREKILKPVAEKDLEININQTYPEEKAPEISSATESTTYEPFYMFDEGSGGSGEQPVEGSVLIFGGAGYATVWLCVSCVLVLFVFVTLTMLTVCFLRDKSHLMTRIGKQTLPFAFFLHSSRPLPDPAASEQLPEEGKSLMSFSKHNQQHFLPIQQEEQEAIHLHNIDYFLSPGAEVDRHE